jgi:hypothetical protein
MDSEKNIEIAPGGEKLVRQFVEAVCDDDAVRDKLEYFLKAEEQDDDTDDPAPSYPILWLYIDCMLPRPSLVGLSCSQL